jgi:hypothetical protein
MGRGRRCGPDRAADREDELSERARGSREERLDLFFAEAVARSFGKSVRGANCAPIDV